MTLISCCFSVWLQKLLNEKSMLVQREVKQEEPAMASGKLNMPAKKVHGKQLKGPPFISKPEDILFKVPVVYWFCKNITSEKTLSCEFMSYSRTNANERLCNVHFSCLKL